MTVVVITPPAAPLVPLATVKAHLRVGDGQDDLISTYLAAASAHIDGPGGWLGKAIGVQTLEARFDRFDCDHIELPYGPLIDVVSVKYDDPDGVEQTVDAEGYTLDEEGLLGSHSGSWPAARLRPGSVRVRYRAGYVADPTANPLVPAVPAPIVAALLLMVGDLEANRSTTIDGTVSRVPMSTTVEDLLQPYRRWA